MRNEGDCSGDVSSYINLVLLLLFEEKKYSVEIILHK